FQEPPEGCVELPPVELPEPAPPTLPAWWEPDAVSDLERRLLGQYCCGVYQPLYLQANPSRYLTFTGVRKRIGGDCSLLLRIFSLMEYTGVINQHAKSRPPGFKKMAVLPQSDAAELCFSCRQQVGKTVYVPPVPTMPLTICSDCYDSGRTMYIPKEFFTRVVKETQWNETRLQALVRAVHQNDDWDQVAQVVSATDPTAPVSREDCLLKFSKLPIEDVLLEVQSRSPQFLRVLLAHAPPELVNAVFDACLETPNDSWCSVLSHNRRLNVQIPVELKTAVGAVHVQQREAVDNLGETLKCADDMACLVDSLVACDDALQAARRSLLSLLRECS
ncbi:MAG: uncharacterized protein KVP18_000321, partial [Porospora cf. gigantea A]|uniref:uncharacterized protein n=1 Tax=Porospora cf. gigantea A TaxID=2853593 RepID=UPI003559D9B7